MGTTVNKHTGRHWFWTSYTLAQENGEWRIQSMTDEGANLQGLPIDELQKQSKVLHDRVDEIVGERQPRDADAQDYIREVLRLVTQAMHYSDALLVKLPLDRSIYAEAAEQAQAGPSSERLSTWNAWHNAFPRDAAIR